MTDQIDGNSVKYIHIDGNGKPAEREVNTGRMLAILFTTRNGDKFDVSFSPDGTGIEINGKGAAISIEPRAANHVRMAQRD